MLTKMLAFGFEEAIEIAIQTRKSKTNKLIAIPEK